MTTHDRPIDKALRERAEAVIPGGMYGHQSAAPAAGRLSAVLRPRPRARGCGTPTATSYSTSCAPTGRTCSATATRRSTPPSSRQMRHRRHPDRPDRADGRAGRAIDRHGHPRRLGDVLQERHRRHLDGPDDRPRPHPAQDHHPGQGRLSRRRALVHAAPAGTTPEDKANQIFCDYNDVASLEAAVRQAGDDLAAIFAAPFKHDAFVDQALPDPAYARRARELCDETGALLVVDDVRAGLRIARDCSWSTVGVAAGPVDLGQVHRQRPSDLGAAGLGQGAQGGRARSSSPARSGSRPRRWPRRWRRSSWSARPTIWSTSRAWARACATAWPSAPTPHGFGLRQTGPVTMPLFLFDDDPDLRKGFCWSSEMLKRGVYVHPWHNMFLCAAMTEQDIDQALDAAEGAFAALKAKSPAALAGGEDELPACLTSILREAPL